MSPSLSAKPFHVMSLQNLDIGRALPPLSTGYDGPTMVKGTGWSLPSGAYTARQIVEGCAPLLETVLHHLGPSPPDQPSAREMLLDNLASNLALGTRESSLDIPAKDASRKEFAAQAVKIGKTLVTYARGIKDVSFDTDYAIRSPCEGHLLKPAVALLMFGPRSLAHLMQIYNEYLHQMVLLRDALLPFDNYDEVVIQITAGEGKQRLGMRFTESNRMRFIAELMTKLTTQKSVVESAQSLLAPDLAAENAYGFQYRHGVVLPAAVVGEQSLRLLRYIPAILDDTTLAVSFDALQMFSFRFRKPVSMDSGIAHSRFKETQTLSRHPASYTFKCPTPMETTKLLLNPPSLLPSQCSGPRGLITDKQGEVRHWKTRKVWDKHARCKLFSCSNAPTL
ncbi:hypothetical protein KCU87_g495, partial [Aureobasidium melanogenum]